jgi:hypothetical protein
MGELLMENGSIKLKTISLKEDLDPTRGYSNIMILANINLYEFDQLI